jgi:hypothetical protein
MSARYRLTINELLDVLSDWDSKVKTPIFLAACGGTALTLYGHKESTKDVDFLLPEPAQYDHLVRTLRAQGYHRATGNGFKHPSQPWIFDLFRGQTIFQTELLDPVQDEGRHLVIRRYKKLVLACLKPDDLIISKMFRGTMVDVDDSIIMIKSEKLDLKELGERYRETAGYYFNPHDCKRKLGYLIDELERQKLDATALREISDSWTP